MQYDYDAIDIGGVIIPHIKYSEIGPQGVGKHKQIILNMDQYIDHNQDEELHQECVEGLAKCEQYYKVSMYPGAIPPEEEKNLGGRSWTSIIADLEKDSLDYKAIERLAKETGDYKAVYRYIYYKLGGVIPWYFGLYIKNNTFGEKRNGGEFTEAAVHFPKLLKYLDTLPFKEIGRVLFFTTYPNTGVAIHRDSPMMNHKDHNINLFFTSGSRKSFIWDEVNKKKIYLDSDARSYYFNNRDFHGVDPEPRFRYTLRIDGTFTDELCENLGLDDGYTWHEKY